ncbi:MAG: recombinase family protein, partial [Deltaproteobacteria bacterium]|nr:recombinase family protein [Deltaproteobacteria bacterium]
MQNQRDYLEKYAQQNGLTPYVHLQDDDGYSGTGWSRPGWQELIAKIESGVVKTVVVKTLDRIGR